MVHGFPRISEMWRHGKRPATKWSFRQIRGRFVRGCENPDRDRSAVDSLCGVSVEPTGDRDLEADLGTFDRMIDQTKSIRIRFDRNGQPPVHDGEVNDQPAG